MRIWTRLASYVRKNAAPDWSVLERFLLWAAGGASASGIVVNPRTAMQAAAVYACIKVLCESVSMLPCNVQQKLAGGKGSTDATDHPLFDLLHDQPNDYQSSVEFWEMAMLHLGLRGNSYSYVNRAKSGRVIELLPQHPDAVIPQMHADYSMTYQVTMLDGSTQILGPDQVLHIKGLTTNGWTGISPIAFQRESIGLALAAEKFGSQLFRNGAKMGGVLEHPGKLSDEAYKRLKDSFDAATSGDNAHKTALLEEGIKYNKVQMSSEDAQFLETRKYQRSEIAAIYRVPPHMIGDLEKATFSNIEQQSLDFVIYTLMPWLVRIEKAVKRDLIDPAERKQYHLKFNVGALLRGDSVARGGFYTAGIGAGWLTRNEARAIESQFGLPLNPIEGLDEPLRPLNMIGINEDPPEPADPPQPVGDPAAKPKPKPNGAGKGAH
jgi:HK97 family phage portal protein